MYWDRDQALVFLIAWVVGGIGTPSIHLRLGACRFELGDRRRAADELARAYIPGGTSVFRAGDQKHLDYIKTQLSPPPGGWPKGW